MPGSSFRALSGSLQPAVYRAFSFEEQAVVSGSGGAVTYGAVGSFRGAISPQSYPGLVQWLDASNVLAMELDTSGRVYKMIDLSGNGNHAQQPSANNRPFYITSSVQTFGDSRMNSNNVVHFNGTANPNSTHLWFRRDNQRVSPPTTLSLFLVWKPQAAGLSSFHGLYLNTANSTWNTGFGMTGNAGANNLLTWVDNYVANTVSKSLTAGNVMLSTMIYNKVNITTYFTGTFVGVDNYTANPTYTQNTVSGSIGIYYGTATDPANVNGPASGSLGEIILYDRALSGAEVNEIHRYLGAKWGISTTLT